MRLLVLATLSSNYVQSELSYHEGENTHVQLQLHEMSL